MGKAKNGGNEYSHTAYDDAFRTIETECDDALIYLVNHVFGEDYDSTARVIRLRNEHFVENKGKQDEKRITDSHFRIRFHEQETSYQIECESSGYSKSIMIRLFQYAVQTAIDEHESSHAKVVLDIPHSGLLVLRDIGSPPRIVTFELHTPGGSVSYDVPVICEADYTIEEMFEGKLYFLLPFFIFNLETRMDDYENDPEAMKEFEKQYNEIIEKLRGIPEGELSLRTKGVIIRDMAKVARRFAAKHAKVRRKVGKIMGGKVQKLEWLERFDAAVAEGEARGEERRLIRMVCRKLRKGYDPVQIADALEEDEARIMAICRVAEEFAPDYDEDKVFEAACVNL